MAPNNAHGLLIPQSIGNSVSDPLDLSGNPCIFDEC